MENKVVYKAISLALKEGNELIENSAHSGAYSDGGGRALINRTLAFKDGWEMRIPEYLAPYMEKARIQVEKEGYQEDPDYKKYLELKERFKHA